MHPDGGCMGVWQASCSRQLVRLLRHAPAALQRTIARTQTHRLCAQRAGYVTIRLLRWIRIYLQYGFKYWLVCAPLVQDGVSPAELDFIQVSNISIHFVFEYFSFRCAGDCQRSVARRSHALCRWRALLDRSRCAPAWCQRIIHGGGRCLRRPQQGMCFSILSLFQIQQINMNHLVLMLQKLRPSKIWVCVLADSHLAISMQNISRSTENRTLSSQCVNLKNKRFCLNWDASGASCAQPLPDLLKSFSGFQKYAASSLFPITCSHHDMTRFRQFRHEADVFQSHLSILINENEFHLQIRSFWVNLFDFLILYSSQNRKTETPSGLRASLTNDQWHRNPKAENSVTFQC